MEYAVEASGLKKYYREVKAVDGINLRIERGELFGFLGVNGAGKSTAINMLCTLLKPTSGEAAVCGYRLGKEDEQIRRSIGVVYQNNCLDERLTVKENLMIRGMLYEDRTCVRKNLSETAGMLGLEALFDKRFGRLSGGQKRRCEIARALLHRPKVLFLDEPTTGLDPATRKAVWDSIKLLRKEQDMTIFLTTHYMEEAAKASHIAILDEGRILEYGTPFSLKDKYAADIVKLYPGNRQAVKRILEENNIPYREKEDMMTVKIKGSLQALPVLGALKGQIAGFEVLQGSMDDVFLSVTGKELEQS